MNRLSSRVQEGEGGGEVGKAQKKGGVKMGEKPVDKDLMPFRNRRRNLHLY